MTKTNYKPAPGQTPDCELCDRESCFNRGRYQRGDRSFTVTSGRCPRLPDTKGVYDSIWYDLTDGADQ